jgi:protein-tyrosine-phosphatase
MKKVIFIGNGDMYRSKFAEAYFNNLGKLECLFMLNTHGMGRYPSSRYPAAYSTNIELTDPAELNEFSKQVCDSYLMFGNDCYTKEHTNITDEDFSHCDIIVVVSEKEQKDFMMEHYEKYADKMQFWNIKKVAGDEKVKKKVAAKIKNKVKELYEDVTKKK